MAGRTSLVRIFNPNLEVNVEEIRALLDEDSEDEVRQQDFFIIPLTLNSYMI